MEKPYTKGYWAGAENFYGEVKIYLKDYCPNEAAAMVIIVVNMILSLILFDKKN